MRWGVVMGLLCAAKVAGGCGPERTATESGADTSSADADSGEPDACTPQSQPDDSASGIDLCEPSTAWNRTETVACSPSLEVPPEDDGCLTDCTEHGGQGVCRRIGGEPFCHYECSADADCGDEGACICAFDGMHSFNQCVRAQCTTGADCPSGECGLSRFCGLVSRLVCRTPADECSGDEQCSGSEAEPHCTYYGSSESFRCDPWVCGE